MAELVVPDLGEVELLRILVSAALVTDEPWLLHLYKNDYTPVRDSELSDFTEADFSGYTGATLDRDTWTAPVSVGGLAQSTYGTVAQSWLCTGGLQTIYGYYVTDEADTVVLWAQRFAVPFPISTGIVLAMTPMLQLRSKSEPV